MKCCQKCANKGCGAYHDKCQPYQEEIAVHRKALSDKYMDNIKDGLAYPLAPGKTRRKRRANATYW